MTAEESKLTAQEMFEGWFEAIYGRKPKSYNPTDHEVNVAYLAAHSAQQKVIDEQAGEIARLKTKLGIAYDELKHAYVFVKTKEKMASAGLDLYLNTMTILQEALAGKEGV